MKKYYTIKDLMDRYRVGRATIYNWMKSKQPLPKPVYLAGLTPRWLVLDIEQWEKEQV